MGSAALYGLVAALVVGLVGAGTASVAPPSPPQRIGGIDLTVDLASLAQEVATFETRLKAHCVPFRDIVTRHTVQPCDGTGEVAAGARLPADAEKRCRQSPYTGTSDASPTNFYDDRQALAVTAYRLAANGKEEARVSLSPNFAHEGYEHISLRRATGEFGTRVD